VRQPFAVCFHARLLSGSPGGDQVETSDAGWFTTGDIPALPIRPAMRLRIGHALTPAPAAAAMMHGQHLAGWTLTAPRHVLPSDENGIVAPAPGSGRNSVLPRR